MRRSRLRSLLLVLGGLAFGAALVWLVGRQIDWPQAATLLKQTDYTWVVLAQVFYALAIGLRVARWHSLLGKAAPSSMADTGVALILGYAVNNLVPARLGEIVRADLLKRRARVARATALGSIVIERAIDLIVVLVMFVVGLATLDSRSEAMDRIFWLALLLTIAALVCLAFTVVHAQAILGRLQRLVGGRLNQALRHLQGRFADFARSMNVLSTRNFLRAALCTIPIWLLESLAIWCICRAVGIELTPKALVLLMAAGCLSTLLPSAPGFIGSYQLAYVLALSVWGIGATLAAVAATTVIVYLIGGLTLAGAVAWLVIVLRPGKPVGIEQAALD